MDWIQYRETDTEPLRIHNTLEKKNWDCQKLPKEAGCDLWYNHNDHMWQCFPSDKPPYTNIDLHISGGILADSMGSGKTVVMITKCLLDATFYDHHPEAVLQFQQQASTTYPTLIPTLATLVVCPIGLVAEWKARLLEFTDYKIGKEIVVVESKRDWNHLTYAKIIDAKIVLVAHRFIDLSKPNYFCGEHETKDPFRFGHNSGTPTVRLEYINAYHRALLQEEGEGVTDLIMNKGVVLHGIYYNRVIFDEIHHHVTKEDKTIKSLKARSYWGLTGTLGINSRGQIKRYKFLL